MSFKESTLKHLSPGLVSPSTGSFPSPHNPNFFFGFKNNSNLPEFSNNTTINLSINNNLNIHNDNHLEPTHRISNNNINNDINNNSFEQIKSEKFGNNINGNSKKNNKFSNNIVYSKNINNNGIDDNMNNNMQKQIAIMKDIIFNLEKQIVSLRNEVTEVGKSRDYLIRENMNLKNKLSEINTNNNLAKTYFDLYKKADRKREEKTNALYCEREKRRNLVRNVHGFGFSNSVIRQFTGDEYCAEIIKFKINYITPLLEDKMDIFTKDVHFFGKKIYQFTNSSNKSYYIRDLKIINKYNPKEKIIFKIQKLGHSFASTYNLQYNNNNNRNNNSNSKHSNSKHSNSKHCNYNELHIIHPDDYFQVYFEYPVIQKEGPHLVTYRLHSSVRERTSSKRNKGAFGEKMEFTYRVVKHD